MRSLTSGQGEQHMSKHNERVFVIGVGMTKFEKPGAREGWDYLAVPITADEGLK